MKNLDDEIGTRSNSTWTAKPIKFPNLGSTDLLSSHIRQPSARILIYSYVFRSICQGCCSYSQGVQDVPHPHSMSSRYQERQGSAVKGRARAVELHTRAHAGHPCQLKAAPSQPARRNADDLWLHGKPTQNDLPLAVKSVLCLFVCADRNRGGTSLRKCPMMD